jgi:hypothetical protein
VAVIRALSLAASAEALVGTLPRTPLAVLPTPLVAALGKSDEDGGTVDILPRLKARDSTCYADWSTR